MSVHDRTVRAAPGWTPQEIHLGFSPDVASTPSGQIAALTMTGVVSRMATSVRITGPDHDLLIHGTRGTLHEELQREIGKVNLTAIVTDEKPDADQSIIGLGVGKWKGPSIHHDLTLSPTANPGVEERWSQCPADHAIVAGLLAAWRAFVQAPVHKNLVPTVEQKVEVPWGPIDPKLLGEPTLLLGAGGLGANYAHFLPWLADKPNLSTVDHDVVSLSNLNRCLPFSLGDVDASHKAQVLTDVVHSAGGRGEAFPERFADVASTVDISSYSRVVLAADEDRVGDLLATHLPAFVITGSMNQDWTASASVHIGGEDAGCAACMWPPRTSTVKAHCGEGQDTTDQQAPLGALPFLAPMNALATLALAGQLNMDGFNGVALELGSPYPKFRPTSTRPRPDCICSQL